MERNPLGLNGRHRAPRRIVTGTLEVLAALAVIAAVCATLAAAAHASTRPAELGYTAARAATVAAERITPSACPVTPDRTRAGRVDADRRVRGQG